MSWFSTMPGVVQQLRGALTEAITLFLAAVAADSDFFYSYLEVAKCYDGLGDRDAALEWYLRTLNVWPHSGPVAARVLACRRAAEISIAQGQHHQALTLLTQGHAVEPTDPDIACALAETLIYHGRRDDVATVFQPVFDAGRMTDAGWQIWLGLLTELSRFQDVLRLTAGLTDSIGFVARYRADVLAGNAALAVQMRRPAILAHARAREASAAWLDSPGVMRVLREAIAARQPLSFVRVGDGEARFVAYCHPGVRPRLHPRHVALLGDVCFQNWFGMPIAQFDPDLILHLNAATLAAIRDADILGVSTADRLEHDHAHFGYLGVLENSLYGLAGRRSGQKLTDALLHIALHRRSPFYAEILSGLDFLGVIGPHVGLAARLARYHGIAETTEIIIPGESRLPGRAAQGAGLRHFPEVFRQICAGLTVPRPGAVYLVAAGLLGKIYCNIIRQRGGIAIDAGSIVDAWVGVNTRPGQYDELADWVLPV